MQRYHYRSPGAAFMQVPSVGASQRSLAHKEMPENRTHSVSYGHNPLLGCIFYDVKPKVSEAAYIFYYRFFVRFSRVLSGVCPALETPIRCS
ncbi:MAG: hypothetical protein ACJAZJ_001556 [Candidatus Endobugula sp.]|jgi:hypothetical protein